jgi:riboflavin synthase
MVPKGSVAIDGISLTINSVSEDRIGLTLIPHTLKETLLESYKLGRRVNIESDMLVRALHHMLSHRNKKDPTWEEVEHWMHLY